MARSRIARNRKAQNDAYKRGKGRVVKTTRKAPLSQLFTNCFTFNAETGTLVSEASTLGLTVPNLLYAETISLKSSHTGKVARFNRTKTDIVDDEVVAWEYAPASYTPKVKKVVILND